MVQANNILQDGQSFFKGKDGTEARKGTIAATMFNVKALDELLKQPGDHQPEEEIESIIQDLQSLLPGLHTVNFFEFFHPIEWMQAFPHLREGRSLVAVLYLQSHPEQLTEEVCVRLKEIQPQVSPRLQREIQKLLTQYAS